MVTLHEVITFLVSMQISISSLQDRKSGSAGMPRPISYAVFCLKKKTPSSAALAALVEMVGRRRRGETTHLVPIGTAGPGEFFGCPFGSFKSSRLMVASALVNTFDSPKRVSTLRM